jgi:hypothetical protein
MQRVPGFLPIYKKIINERQLVMKTKENGRGENN